MRSAACRIADLLCHETDGTLYILLTIQCTDCILRGTEGGRSATASSAFDSVYQNTSMDFLIRHLDRAGPLGATSKLDASLSTQPVYVKKHLVLAQALTQSHHIFDGGLGIERSHV